VDVSYSSTFDEITWVEPAANYIRINTCKESYLLREGIGRVAERLDPTQFVRIHRSLIVNVKHIKELQPVNSGEYIVVLKGGKELSCSRSFRAGLQTLIGQAFWSSVRGQVTKAAGRPRVDVSKLPFDPFQFIQMLPEWDNIEFDQEEWNAPVNPCSRVV
jgi:hypothetical protein